MGAGFSTGGGQSKGGMSHPVQQAVQYPMPAGYDPNVHQPSIGFMPGFARQMPIGGFAQPDQASVQMQADAAARNQVPWYMRPPGMNERPGPYERPGPVGVGRPAGEAPPVPQMSPYDRYMSRFRSGAQVGPPGPNAFAEENQAYLDAQRDFRSQSRSRFAADQPRSLAENMQATADLSGARSFPQAQAQVLAQQSPFGMPMQRPMPYQQPMYQPMMQPYQPYQTPYAQSYQQRVQPNMFGGLAALMPFLRRQY